MTYQEWHETMLRKAMALLAGSSPYTNVIPTLDVVKAADALGYDVVRRDVPQKTQSRER